MLFSRITVKYFGAEKREWERERMQATNEPLPEAGAGTYQDKVNMQKELVESLRAQWKLLWSERFNDKVRAEDVSLDDYIALSVERGTIIHANRDFKAVSFKEILEQHEISNPDRFIQPDAKEGGWNKFVKTKISPPKTEGRKLNTTQESKKRKTSQPGKSGRGWLHVT